MSALKEEWSFRIIAAGEEIQPEEQPEQGYADGEEDDVACATCAYWYQDEEASGECRRYPPTIMNVVSEEDGSILPTSLFPRTENTSYCGEFEMAE